MDKSRFGITGRSGGAAMSWFSAAVDSRLKVAVPVMGNSTYAANVAANTQKGHCDCMFPINTYQHDLMTQGALIAPRPLHMMHGKQDTLFPVPGYEEFEAKIGALYRAFGAGEKFRNTVVDTGHKDSEFLREQAIKWFDRFLMQVPERPIDLTTDLESPEKLAVFAGSPAASGTQFSRARVADGQPINRGAQDRCGMGGTPAGVDRETEEASISRFPGNRTEP